MYATSAMAGVVASLRPDVMVNAPRVKLADIIQMESDSGKPGDAISKSLGSIDLGTAPLPGYSVRYSRKEIDRIVRANGQAQGIEWRGADTVKVERLAKFFDNTQLIAVVESHIKQILSNGQNQVEVELAERLPELLLAEGKIDIKPRPLTMADAMHSKVTVWLDIAVAGVFSRSVRVPVKVKVFDKTLVAKRDLPKGVTPTCEDLLVQELDVASLDGTNVSADCAALKGNLKRNIQAGMALTRSYIQVPMAISHGDTINLLLSAGALTLESRGIAMADGEIGQRIQVKPTAATDTIAAIVVAPGVAKVIGN
ncbi:flagellar basal body P-ring formation chaperone FlgA [Undibacterium sp. Di26W]|uniref:flagellar basal body P-ring formation chaperone FlgA n=1 Tax=Undibacterium sp. Di26W TaxID=3413035 RepID=UPI003BF370DB